MRQSELMNRIKEYPEVYLGGEGDILSVLQDFIILRASTTDLDVTHIYLEYDEFHQKIKYADDSIILNDFSNAKSVNVHVPLLTSVSRQVIVSHTSGYRHDKLNPLFTDVIGTSLDIYLLEKDVSSFKNKFVECTDNLRKSLPDNVRYTVNLNVTI